MTQRILELAAKLGQIGEDEQAAAQVLCAAAQQELTGRLRPGADPERDCPDAFCMACGWLVLAGLAVGREAGEAQSFTAGDVTIRRGEAGTQAQALRQQAERLMAPWLRDDGFLFCGVDGI